MKILLDEGLVIQIMNLLKQLPYYQIEGVLLEIQNSKALNETVNPIGFNSPQYNEPNDEENDEIDE